MRSFAYSALLLALALTVVASPALAQIKTFRKEVKQIMGSAQSQDDARAAALAKARRDALEEAGTWLESQSELRNFDLVKDQVTTLATGITQTKVVEEAPYLENGVIGFRVVAEVSVDNSGLAERVKQFLADRAQVQQAQAISEREQVLLVRLADLERQMASLKAGPSEQRQAVREAVQENARKLTAREWFERGRALAPPIIGPYTDPNRAVAYYSEALKLDPSYTEAFINQGIAYGESEQHQRAIEDFDQALKLDPNNAYVYILRGFAHIDLKQFQRAIQDFDRVIKDDPNGAVNYLVRGQAYVELKQYQRGIQDYNRAIKLEPDRGDTYNLRGLAYVELKQYQRAIQDYRKACNLGNPSACNWLKENPK